MLLKAMAPLRAHLLSDFYGIYTGIGRPASLSPSR